MTHYSDSDQLYMRRAIELAKKGAGFTSPNPLVGAVIVKDGRIIGEGYHKMIGGLHAEREAFRSLTESAKGATIYVTLEPCCHYGHQPPCTLAIVENGIKRVVIGSADPNPLVAGKGSEYLRSNGILVEENCLRKECDALNPIFFHYITTRLPYVTMKYAMTLDGKIATRTGASKWITSEEARRHVHELRGRYSSILAGIGTVVADDPLLNCRLEKAHQPLRIVADSKLQIPENCQLVNTADTYRTIVACAVHDPEKEKRLQAKHVEILYCPEDASTNDSPALSSGEKNITNSPHVDLWKLIQLLGEKQIDSVLIEGGGILHEAALRAGIVNHVCAYIAPKLFGGQNAKTPVEGLGVELPDDGALLEHPKITPLGQDLLLEYDLKGGMNHVYRNH